MIIPCTPLTRMACIAVICGASGIVIGYAWGQGDMHDEKLAAVEHVALQTQLELESAGRLNLRIKDISIRSNVAMALHASRSAQLVEEVRHDLAHAPTLDGIAVPARTRELRQQQVADSAAIAAEASAVR